MKKLLILIIVICGCSPKVVVNQYNENNPYPETEMYDSFALIENNEKGNSSDDMIIADIEIKDNGLSINCDYETVKRLAEKQARLMGGNCLVITEHKEPNMKSTCHRIKAQVLKIKDPEKYEKHILWHPKRPLKILNFRGSIDKRPFQAATYSMIRYYAKLNPINGKVRVIVESLFDCDLSYFKKSDSDSSVLAHEQLHFDITEIYARKFRKTIIEEISNYNEFLGKHESIFSAIHKELAIKQDEYDSEVYSDKTLQSKWNEWVEVEMESLDKFNQREIEIGNK